MGCDHRQASGAGPLNWAEANTAAVAKVVTVSIRNPFIFKVFSWTLVGA